MNVNEKKQQIKKALEGYCYSGFLKENAGLDNLLTELCELSLIAYKKTIAPHILAIRDEVVDNDKPDAQEIYHHVYLIASPSLEKLSDEVWKEFEEIIKTEK